MDKIRKLNYFGKFEVLCVINYEKWKIICMCNNNFLLSLCQIIKIRYGFTYNT